MQRRINSNWKINRKENTRITWTIEILQKLSRKTIQYFMFIHFDYIFVPVDFPHIEVSILYLFFQLILPPPPLFFFTDLFYRYNNIIFFLLYVEDICNKRYIVVCTFFYRKQMLLLAWVFEKNEQKNRDCVY